MSNMLNRKISLVYKKAKERPKGYVDDIKNHSTSWDEKTNRYLITQENWDKLCLKYRKNNTNKQHPVSSKCSFASCGCKGKPITCNHIANKDNLCPNKFDMDCEFRNKPSAEILPFYQTRKDICNACKNQPSDCPIFNQTPCGINRILNDPKHSCPNKLWDRESDHIFYDYKGKSITETEWKKKKQEKEENPV